MNDVVKKSFLENMFTDMDDINSGTDDDVTKELASLGVDINKAKMSFEETLIACKRAQKRSLLRDREGAI